MRKNYYEKKSTMKKKYYENRWPQMRKKCKYEFDNKQNQQKPSKREKGSITAYLDFHFWGWSNFGTF